MIASLNYKLSLLRFTTTILLTSYRAFLVFVKLTFDEPQYQTRFPNSRFSQKYQLELTDFSLACTVWPLSTSTSGGHVFCYLKVPTHIIPFNQQCQHYFMSILTTLQIKQTKKFAVLQRKQRHINKNGEIYEKIFYIAIQQYFLT